MKSGTKLKAKFSSPLVPKASKKVSGNRGECGSSSKGVKKVPVSVNDGDAGVKGEKSKVVAKKGVAGDCGDGGSSSEDQVCAGARQSITKEELEHYCRYLGDGRGEYCYCC